MIERWTGNVGWGSREKDLKKNAKNAESKLCQLRSSVPLPCLAVIVYASMRRSAVKKSSRNDATRKIPLIIMPRSHKSSESKHRVAMNCEKNQNHPDHYLQKIGSMHLNKLRDERIVVDASVWSSCHVKAWY